MALPVVLGIDSSYSHFSGADIRARGYLFDMMYLSYETAKDASLARIQDCHAHGVAVGFVWETTGRTPLGGAAAGAADGAAAGALMREMGVPASVPIFWTFDTDPAGFSAGWLYPTLKAYGDAFARASGHFSFPYGSGAVIDYFQAGWQAEAWSGSYVSPHAYLYQRIVPTNPQHFDTQAADENVLFNSYALYLPVPPAPPAPPKPQPRPMATTDLAHLLPTITASDHTHPKALETWRYFMARLFPKADTKTDKGLTAVTEQFRAFFLVGGDVAPRIGPNMWAAAEYLVNKEH